ncbi:uncharacterized protein LOC135819217 [Sycon ciliatum]|uniref:uncharacterized protein LOC135819217 n=1 Tax=Sycon ciliatum TaxID=27933 RepID=UPI0031F65E12
MAESTDGDEALLLEMFKSTIDEGVIRLVYGQCKGVADAAQVLMEMTSSDGKTVSPEHDSSELDRLRLECSADEDIPLGNSSFPTSLEMGFTPSASSAAAVAGRVSEDTLQRQVNAELAGAAAVDVTSIGEDTTPDGLAATAAVQVSPDGMVRMQSQRQKRPAETLSPLGVPSDRRQPDKRIFPGVAAPLSAEDVRACTFSVSPAAATGVSSQSEALHASATRSHVHYSPVQPVYDSRRSEENAYTTLSGSEVNRHGSLWSSGANSSSQHAQQSSQPSFGHPREHAGLSDVSGDGYHQRTTMSNSYQCSPLVLTADTPRHWPAAADDCGTSAARPVLVESRRAPEKIMYILRGLPGSGKSYLAKQLSSERGQIVSADYYFMRDGRYEFDPSQIGRAHEWCQSKAKDHVAKGVSPIVVDNTNTQLWEMKPYVVMARDGGYEIEIREPTTSWKWNVQELARRNSHGVPADKIRLMKDRFRTDATINAIVGAAAPKSKSRPSPQRDHHHASPGRTVRPPGHMESRPPPRPRGSVPAQGSASAAASGGDASPAASTSTPHPLVPVTHLDVQSRGQTNRSDAIASSARAPAFVRHHPDSSVSHEVLSTPAGVRDVSPVKLSGPIVNLPPSSASKVSPSNWLFEDTSSQRRSLHVDRLHSSQSPTPGMADSPYSPGVSVHTVSDVPVSPPQVAMSSPDDCGRVDSAATAVAEEIRPQPHTVPRDASAQHSAQRVPGQGTIPDSSNRHEARGISGLGNTPYSPPSNSSEILCQSPATSVMAGSELAGSPYSPPSSTDTTRGQVRSEAALARLVAREQNMSDSTSCDMDIESPLATCDNPVAADECDSSVPMPTQCSSGQSSGQHDLSHSREHQLPDVATVSVSSPLLSCGAGRSTGGFPVQVEEADGPSITELFPSTGYESVDEEPAPPAYEDSVRLPVRQRPPSAPSIGSSVLNAAPNEQIAAASAMSEENLIITAEPTTGLPNAQEIHSIPYASLPSPRFRLAPCFSNLPRPSSRPRLVERAESVPSFSPDLSLPAPGARLRRVISASESASLPPSDIALDSLTAVSGQPSSSAVGADEPVNRSKAASIIGAVATETLIEPIVIVTPEPGTVEVAAAAVVVSPPYQDVSPLTESVKFSCLQTSDVSEPDPLDLVSSPSSLGSGPLSLESAPAKTSSFRSSLDQVADFEGQAPAVSGAHAMACSPPLRYEVSEQELASELTRTDYGFDGHSVQSTANAGTASVASATASAAVATTRPAAMATAPPAEEEEDDADLCQDEVETDNVVFLVEAFPNHSVRELVQALRRSSGDASLAMMSLLDEDDDGFVQSTTGDGGGEVENSGIDQHDGVILRPSHFAAGASDQLGRPQAFMDMEVDSDSENLIRSSDLQAGLAASPSTHAGHRLSDDERMAKQLQEQWFENEDTTAAAAHGDSNHQAVAMHTGEDTGDPLLVADNSPDTVIMQMSDDLALRLQLAFGDVGFDAGGANLRFMLSKSTARKLYSNWVSAIRSRQRDEEARLQIQLNRDEELARELMEVERLHVNAPEGVPLPQPEPENPLPSEASAAATSARRVRPSRVQESHMAGDSSSRPSLWPERGQATTPDLIPIRFVPAHRHSDMPQAAPAASTTRGTQPIRMVVPSVSDSSIRSAPSSILKATKHSEGDDGPGQVQSLENPEYQDYRAEAQLHRDQYNECIRKSKEAYSRRQGALAQHYSQQSRGHYARYQEANQRAAQMIFHSKNPLKSADDQIDLHGLHVNEAVDLLDDILTTQEEAGTGRKYILVVTGRGAHSVGNRPKVRPAVERYLASHHYRFEHVNPGLIKVHLRSH